MMPEIENEARKTMEDYGRMQNSKRYIDRIVYLDSIIGQAMHQFFLDTGIRVGSVTRIDHRGDGTFKLDFTFEGIIETQIHGRKIDI